MQSAETGVVYYVQVGGYDSDDAGQLHLESRRGPRCLSNSRVKCPDPGERVTLCDDIVTYNRVMTFVQEQNRSSGIAVSLDMGTLTPGTTVTVVGNTALSPEGNVYITGGDDYVNIYDAAGNLMEKIVVSITKGHTANVCFGGRDKQTLFITAGNSLFSIRMRVKGF